MTTQSIVLRAVLGILAIYHLGIGLLSILSPAWTARVSKGLYAISLEGTPQFRYALKMLGLYALTIGFLLVLAAWRPEEHREIIVAIILLQSMRALFRLFYNPMVTDAFSVPTSRNVLNASLLLAEVVALLACFPRGPL